MFIFGWGILFLEARNSILPGYVVEVRLLELLRIINLSTIVILFLVLGVYFSDPVHWLDISSAPENILRVSFYRRCGVWNITIKYDHEDNVNR